MHIAFSILFVGLLALFETVRHGVFGLSPSEIIGTIYLGMALGAVVLLRGDLLFVLQSPRRPLYGHSELNWTWPRTVLGLLLGPLLWVVPLAYGTVLVALTLDQTVVASLLQAVVLQTVLVGFAEGLFFREAVLKAFAGSRFQIYTISTLAVFVFYVPTGVVEALIAAGAAVFFMTLRLIGTNILVVATVHGASVVAFTQVFDLGLTGSQPWTYAAFFVAGATGLSILIHFLFTTDREDYSHA